MIKNSNRINIYDSISETTKSRDKLFSNVFLRKFDK